MKFMDIEDSIISTLRRDLPALRMVEAYAGQLEGEIEKLPVRLPAAFVVYGGSDYSDIDGLSIRERALFSILVAGRMGSGVEGACAMAGTVLATLANNALGLEMERLAPERMRLVHHWSGTAVYGIELHADFDTEYGN